MHMVVLGGDTHRCQWGNSTTRHTSFATCYWVGHLIPPTRLAFFITADNALSGGHWRTSLLLPLRPPWPNVPPSPLCARLSPPPPPASFTLQGTTRAVAVQGLGKLIRWAFGEHRSPGWVATVGRFPGDFVEGAGMGGLARNWGGGGG